jgi:hypothetical protein
MDSANCTSCKTSVFEFKPTQQRLLGQPRLAPIAEDLEMPASAISLNDNELASSVGISNDPHEVVRSLACV